METIKYHTLRSALILAVCFDSSALSKRHFDFPVKKHLVLERDTKRTCSLGRSRVFKLTLHLMLLPQHCFLLLPEALGKTLYSWAA